MIKLTPRQLEVLALCGKGYSIPRMAQELGISQTSTDTQLRELRARMGGEPYAKRVTKFYIKEFQYEASQEPDNESDPLMGDQVDGWF